MLVDTRRIEQCHASLDFFEEAQIPFVIGVNHFAGSERFEPEEVRDALGVPDRIPMVNCDARDRESVKQVAVALVDTAMVAVG